MLYVADTMALVWHLEKHRGLGAQARKVLQEADQGLHTIVISGATLMEILYLVAVLLTGGQIRTHNAGQKDGIAKNGSTGTHEPGMCDQLL